MNSLNVLTLLFSFIAVFVGLQLYDRYGPYLRVKRNLLRRLGSPVSLLRGNPPNNRDYDPAAFQAYEQAFNSSGFTKLGEGELTKPGQQHLPNFFMFFSHPEMNCAAIARQVFTGHLPNAGVQVSITTRMEDGTRILTRNAQTYSDLTLPEEILVIVPDRPAQRIIDSHFQRLSALKPFKPLPTPTTLEECLALINERGVRQVQAMREKRTLRVAVSFFKWRKIRRAARQSANQES